MTAIVVVMMLTNPSISSLKSYLHNDYSGSLGRDFNGLLFSVYSNIKRNYNSSDSSSHTQIYYIGILGNFFKSPF
jgi:hypothetical protein